MTAAEIPSLYVHVPFCASICYYCDFFRQAYRPETADRWLDAIQTELEHTELNPALQTIYIGGGTPTCLSEPQLDRLLNLLDPYKKNCAEFTVECNPETLSEAKIDLLCMHGVNRVSIGMQTGDSVLLKKMNRHHTFDEIQCVVNQFQTRGISNISLDLMYSLPDQTMEQLQESTRMALSLHPSHLSLYSLTIEENSVFGRQGVQALDEDTEADMYEWLCRYLKQQGYEHYEISNFALPGKQSLHNSLVWEYHDFYGIGAGAWGKDADGRYEHAQPLKAYLEDPLKKIYTHLSKEECMYETVMMGLRLRRGLSRALFQERYDRDLTEVYPVSIRTCIERGYLNVTDERICCTEKGFELLNEVLILFMEEAGL